MTARQAGVPAPTASVSAPASAGAVLAFGAWLKNAACLWSPAGAQWSDIHGDLGNPDARLALKQSIQALESNASRTISAVAHDLHPDFYSTELALEMAAQLDVPAIGVQHHHAHIGAVIAEHGITNGVVGLALDGVGLGTDGTAWGGELLWVDGAQWARIGHFEPMALPGGDRAAIEPWRMAASAMHLLGRTAQIAGRFATAVGASTASGVAQMLTRGINCPQTSSAGRWFDAAAGALGISIRQTEEAQAAQALEQLATQWLAHNPWHELPVSGITITPANTLDATGMFADLLDAPPEQHARISAQFHITLAERLVEWVSTACQNKQTRTVCLGGGCFYNRVLSQHLITALKAEGLTVFLPGQYGCGDAGLAVGQAWVAHQQLNAATAAAQQGSELCA